MFNARGKKMKTIEQRTRLFRNVFSIAGDLFFLWFKNVSIELKLHARKTYCKSKSQLDINFSYIDAKMHLSLENTLKIPLISINLKVCFSFFRGSVAYSIETLFSVDTFLVGFIINHPLNCIV